MEVVQELEDDKVFGNAKGDKNLQRYLDLANELSSDDDVEPVRPTDSMVDKSYSREVTFQDYMVNQ